MVLRANKPLRLLNEFLSECDVKRVDNPQFEWLKSADRTKRRYIQHTRDILVAVLKVVSPENAGYLWSALQATRAVNDELGAEGIMLPSQRLYLEAIAETYKNAGSWDTRRQILSIMTATASFSTIREFIPGLSQRANHEDQKFKNHRKSITVSWPLSVKQAAKITLICSVKTQNPLEHNLLAREKNVLEQEVKVV